MRASSTSPALPGRSRSIGARAYCRSGPAGPPDSGCGKAPTGLCKHALVRPWSLVTLDGRGFEEVVQLRKVPFDSYRPPDGRRYRRRDGIAAAVHQWVVLAGAPMDTETADVDVPKHSLRDQR